MPRHPSRGKTSRASSSARRASSERHAHSDSDAPVEKSARRRNTEASNSMSRPSSRVHSPQIQATKPVFHQSPAKSPMLPPPWGGANNKGAGSAPENNHNEAPAKTPKAAPASNMPAGDLYTPSVTFNLVTDPQRGARLNPRDVGSMLLWCTPTPGESVPPVECPRWLAVENRSRISNVCVVHINGISHDQIKALPVEVPANSRGKCYNTDLCDLLLKPVRTFSAGGGSEGGRVQVAPLWIPNTHDRAEQDLFFRNKPGHLVKRHPRPNQNGEEDGDGRRHQGVSETGRPRRSTADLMKAMAAHREEHERRVQNGEESPAESVVEEPQQAEEADPNGHFGHKVVNFGFSGDAMRLWGHPAASLGADEAAAALPRSDALLLKLSLTVKNDVRQLASLGYVLPPALANHARRGAGLNNQQINTSDYVHLHTHITHARRCRAVAFDCEMVLLADGVFALARITLVDVPSGEVVMDRLVSPGAPVVDYLERFSGMSAALLDPVTTTLADIQNELREELLDSETFVIGHSMENDFKACKIFPDCRIVDTAHLFPHPNGQPVKHALRYLVQEHLNKQIQRGSHDSAVDAAVTAELVTLKLIHGKSYGVPQREHILSMLTDPRDPVTGKRLPKPEEGAAAEDGEKKANSSHKHGRRPIPDGPSNSLDDKPRLRSTLIDMDARGLRSILDAATPPPSGVIAKHEKDGLKQAANALRPGSGAHPDSPAFVYCHLRGYQTMDLTIPTPKNFKKLLSSRVAERNEHQAKRDAAKAESKKSSESVAAVEPLRELDPTSADDAEAFLATHERIEFLNKRVAELIDSAPLNTLFVFFVGNCRSDAGNRHATAQGMVFSFVKGKDTALVEAAEAAQKSASQCAVQ